MIFWITLFLSAFAVCESRKVLTSLPYNFTLAAVNVTLPNANRTGVPLVLGQNGASTGVSYKVTSTYASYPYDDYPSLALVNQSLRAFTTSGEWITNATAVLSGGTLGWVVSRGSTAVATKNYTAVERRDSKFAVLAAYGIVDLWSLCPSYAFRGQNNVVFNVSADIPLPQYAGFDPADCYAVTLNIVPTQ